MAVFPAVSTGGSYGLILQGSGLIIKIGLGGTASRLIIGTYLKLNKRFEHLHRVDKV